MEPTTATRRRDLRLWWWTQRPRSWVNFCFRGRPLNNPNRVMSELCHSCFPDWGGLRHCIRIKADESAYINVCVYLWCSEHRGRIWIISGPLCGIYPLIVPKAPRIEAALINNKGCMLAVNGALQYDMLHSGYDTQNTSPSIETP